MPQDHKYWVYIVASLTGTLYIGMTNNIERRVSQHKEGTIEGFASKYNCDRLVYWKSFDDVRKAIDREKQLKGWRREKKIALIKTLNPHWRDLAKDWGQPIELLTDKLSSWAKHFHPRSGWKCEVEGPLPWKLRREPAKARIFSRGLSTPHSHANARECYAQDDRTERSLAEVNQSQP